MMKLPNSNNVVVDAEKITGYLLNPEHPDNGGKARFFFGLGFSREDFQVLDAAFRKLAVAGSIVKSMETSHGRKYIIDGRIVSPSGKNPAVRTVWIVDRGLESPRLVTAYPLEGRKL